MLFMQMTVVMVVTNVYIVKDKDKDRLLSKQHIDENLQMLGLTISYRL